MNAVSKLCETAKIRGPVKQNSNVLPAFQWLNAMVCVGSGGTEAVHSSKSVLNLAAAEMRLCHRLQFEAKNTSATQQVISTSHVLNLVACS